MGLPYFDRRSAVMRLDETICLYNGAPVYISLNRYPGGEREPRPRARVDEQLLVARPRHLDDHVIPVFPLPYIHNMPPIEIDYREPAFSYKAFPLGYINADAACYLARLPNRQQRQGLAFDCITGVPDRPRLQNWFTSDAMKRCILGLYPSAEDAENELDSYSRQSVAITREVALYRSSGNGTMLYYRGRMVGYKDFAGKYVLFPSKETNALNLVLKDVICLK